VAFPAYTVFVCNQPLGKTQPPTLRRGMSTGQAAVAVLCGREVNRRSGVASAMRHRLCGIFTYGFNGLRKGDVHLAYTPVRVYLYQHSIRDMYYISPESYRRREMYCGHPRLCVCVPVCPSAAACLRHYTYPDVTCGSGRGCPLVVHYWAELQSRYGVALLWQHNANAKCLYSPYA